MTDKIRTGLIELLRTTDRDKLREAEEIVLKAQELSVLLGKSILFDTAPEKLQLIFLDVFQPFLRGVGVKTGEDVKNFPKVQHSKPMNCFRNFPHREKIVSEIALPSISSNRVLNACGGPDANGDAEYKSMSLKPKQKIGLNFGGGQCDKIDNPKNVFEKRFDKPFVSSLFLDDALAPPIVFVCYPKGMAAWKESYESAVEKHQEYKRTKGGGNDSWSFKLSDIAAAKGELLRFDAVSLARNNISFSDEAWSMLSTHAESRSWNRLAASAGMTSDVPMSKPNVEKARKFIADQSLPERGDSV